MALISIQQGAVAKSSVLNDNFNYLESLCTSISNSTLDKTTINNLVNSAGTAKVNKTGDTMTGNLVINKEQGYIVIKEPNLEYATIPTSQSVTAFRVSDKNNLALGDIRFTRDTSGGQTTALYARNKVSGTDKVTTIAAGVSATGSRYVRLTTDEFSINGKNVPYVTERVVSGSSWYETWSDGTIKQGGQVLLSSGTGLKTFNLVKNYTTNTYVLTGICKFNDGVDGNGSDQSYVNAVRLSSQTTSTFTLQSAMGEATYFNWEAVGK